MTDVLGNHFLLIQPILSISSLIGNSDVTSPPFTNSCTSQTARCGSTDWVWLFLFICLCARLPVGHTRRLTSRGPGRMRHSNSEGSLFLCVWVVLRVKLSTRWKGGRNVVLDLPMAARRGVSCAMRSRFDLGYSNCTAPHSSRPMSLMLCSPITTPISYIYFLSFAHPSVSTAHDSFTTSAFSIHDGQLYRHASLVALRSFGRTIWL